jgi:hypothetical protein
VSICLPDLLKTTTTIITIIIITQNALQFKRNMDKIERLQELILIFHLLYAIISVKILLMTYLIAESEENYGHQL